ncbi:MAG TPA: heme o synthase [Candidatus Sulfomarinibacteraceae bacterium]|nr:heme o synthase [Candidatus Sulfomarinibacteraceae bacterium]
MSIKTSEQKAYQESIPASLVPSKATWREFLQMLVVLFKLRIVALLLLGAVGGAFLGAQGWPGVGNLLLLLLTGGMAAAGSSALNEYIERRSDELMRRTRLRPLPAGQISRPRLVVLISLALILAPSLAVAPFNPALAFWLLAGAFVYVVVYTLWLKPRTLLNIVIGGGAGSAAVLSGGAVVGAWQDPAVITLALLVFLWTPSHFWSLAILYKNDYGRAEVPMLPVHTTLRQAAWWVFLHTGATGVAALLLAASPALGLVYLLPVLAATADMLWRNVKLIREPTPRNARGLFIASNVYLTVVLFAAMASVVLRRLWPVL